MTKLTENDLKIEIGTEWQDRRGVTRRVMDILTTANSAGQVVRVEYARRAIVGGVPSYGRFTATEINRARYAG